MITDSKVTSNATEQPIPETECHSRSIDWYAEGQARTVEVGGVQITIQFVGRKGRRGRIAITAPAGADFRTPDKIAKSIQRINKSSALASYAGSALLDE